MSSILKFFMLVCVNKTYWAVLDGRRAGPRARAGRAAVVRSGPFDRQIWSHEPPPSTILARAAVPARASPVPTPQHTPTASPASTPQHAPTASPRLLTTGRPHRRSPPRPLVESTMDAARRSSPRRSSTRFGRTSPLCCKRWIKSFNRV